MGWDGVRRVTGQDQLSGPGAQWPGDACFAFLRRLIERRLDSGSRKWNPDPGPGAQNRELVRKP